MKKIIQKAEEWARQEYEKYGTPLILHLDLSNKKGQELAEKLNANKELVLIGTWLMDIKLGLCWKENRLDEHVKESVNTTKKFLEQFNLEQETKEKIINCVEGHHGNTKFICKEAEICANADCYRFLHPRGVFAYFELLGKRTNDFEKILNQVDYKLEEKWNCLSLNECKQELEKYYLQFKELIKLAH